MTRQGREWLIHLENAEVEPEDEIAITLLSIAHSLADLVDNFASVCRPVDEVTSDA